MSGYESLALLHEPFWRACCSTDADRVDVFYPFDVDFFCRLYLVGVRVHLFTFVEEHLPVAAFASRDKEDEFMSLSKLCDVGDSVGNLPADGVETSERSASLYMLLDVMNDMVVFLQRLGGL